ncbi:GRAM domain-containing protein [Ancistrocladus abbreviatus]
MGKISAGKVDCSIVLIASLLLVSKAHEVLKQKKIEKTEEGATADVHHNMQVCLGSAGEVGEQPEKSHENGEPASDIRYVLSILVLLSRPRQMHVIPQADHATAMGVGSSQRTAEAMAWLGK